MHGANKAIIYVCPISQSFIGCSYPFDSAYEYTIASCYNFVLRVPYSFKRKKWMESHLDVNTLGGGGGGMILIPTIIDTME